LQRLKCSSIFFDKGENLQNGTNKSRWKVRIYSDEKRRLGTYKDDVLMTKLEERLMKKSLLQNSTLKY